MVFGLHYVWSEKRHPFASFDISPYVEYLSCQTLNVPRQIIPSCKTPLQKYLFLILYFAINLILHLFEPHTFKILLLPFFWIFFQKELSKPCVLLHNIFQKFFHKNELWRTVLKTYFSMTFFFLMPWVYRDIIKLQFSIKNSENIKN